MANSLALAVAFCIITRNRLIRWIIATKNLGDLNKGEKMLVNMRSGHVAILMFIAVFSACTHGINESLIRAAKNGDLEKVERLISKGADINFIAIDGSYALEEAASENRPDVVRALLAKGAKLHHVPGKMTPPEIAASKGYMDILNAFLESGYNVNTKQSYGYSLLHVAAQDGENKIIETLLKKGADINERDDNGATPLFHAAGANYENCVKVLLDAGANPNIQTKDGNCPLTVALAERHSAIVEMLKKKGARECR